MRRYRLAFSVLSLAVILGCNQSNLDRPARQMSIPDVPADIQHGSVNPDRPVPIRITDDGATKTTVESTIIDTSKFETQVWRNQAYRGKIRSTELVRSGEAEMPEIRQAPVNDLLTDGNIVTSQRLDPVINFPGISQSFFTPPDPTLAVGPNHVVQMVNSEIAFLSKSGTVEFQAPLGSQGSPGFFDDVGAGDFCVDPRCVYDHYSGRYVVLCLEVYFGSVESYLTIAVSDDDDPNGVWFKYRVNAVFDHNGDENFADYPSLGYDQNGYYISGNLFGITTFDFNGVGFRTMDKTPMLNGQPIVVNDFVGAGLFSTVQVAQSFGTPTTPYAISFDSSSSANVIAINDPFGNPSLSTVSVSIPSFDGHGGVNNQGASISAVGGRSMNAHYRDGSLYTCHSVAGIGKAVARWYEFDVSSWPGGSNPTLVQSGDIDLGPGQETFFPSIYSNSSGGLAIVFGNSSSSDLISVKASGRLASDPLGTMGAPVELAVSTVATNGRYGDYFDIAIDPNDDQTFWMTGETGKNFGWDTTINSFSLLLLGDVNCDGEVNLLDVDPFIELISSGEYSDKADLNQDGSVNLLDVDPFIELLSN